MHAVCLSSLLLAARPHTAHIAQKTHIAHAHCTCTRHTRTAHEYCTCTPHIRAHTQTLPTQHCACTMHTHHKCTPSTNTADICYTHTALTFAHKTFPTHIAHARINAPTHAHTCTSHTCIAYLTALHMQTAYYIARTFILKDAPDAHTHKTQIFMLYPRTHNC